MALIVCHILRLKLLGRLILTILKGGSLRGGHMLKQECEKKKECIKI